MHKALVDATIDQVRKRASEGDCPTTPACSVEWLENALLALAARAASPALREAGEPVAWRWRWTADAYGIHGATPGRWTYQETRPDAAPVNSWQWEVQPLYASPVQREGMVQVPREPTEEMLVAFHTAVEDSVFDEPLSFYREAYAALLSAAEGAQ